MHNNLTEMRKSHKICADDGMMAMKLKLMIKIAVTVVSGWEKKFKLGKISFSSIKKP